MSQNTKHAIWWSIWATIVAAGLGMIGIAAGELAFAQVAPTTQLVIPPSTQPTVISILTTISISGPAGMAPSTQPATQPAPARMALGTNLSSNDPWQTDAAWCDFTHRMTGWYQRTASDPPVQYDANGYPQTPAYAHGWPYGYPGGIWTVTWQGGANFSIVGKTIDNPVTDANGITTGTVVFQSGEFVKFQATGPVSNVHLYSPDAPADRTQIFRPAFLAALKQGGQGGYKVVRTMPWNRPNGDMPRPNMNAAIDIGGGTNKPAWPTSWGMRNLPTNWDQTTKEVALEYQFELAKESGCTLWLNTYWGEDDDSLTRKAQLAASYNLPGGLIVEPMGNEPWNTAGVYQGNDIRKAGQAAGFTGDINQAGAKYAAAQGAHVAAIFRSILGNKVKIVFSGQATWGAWMSDGLSSVPAGTFDAGVVAPYFQSANPLTGGAATSSSADIEAGCSIWITGTLAPGLAQNWAACQAAGAQLWAYEGGQHLLPINSAVSSVPMQDTAAAQALFNADPITQFQNDAAIGRLYDQLFTVCRQNRVTEFTHFLLLGYWGRSGYWGAKQLPGDPDNPKTLALMRAAAGN